MGKFCVKLYDEKKTNAAVLVCWSNGNMVDRNRARMMEDGFSNFVVWDGLQRKTVLLTDRALIH